MDDRLQRLKRAAAGDRAARARLLQERLRRGELTPERLELLAYLGDYAARDGAPQAPSPPETLVDWVEALRVWGSEALLRALAAAARAALPAAEAERRPCDTCGNYGQVQVPFAQGYDWEPCPDCAHCGRCQGSRHFGPQRLPCPECVDLRPRLVVELLEDWLGRAQRPTWWEHFLAGCPDLSRRADWDDPNRPAVRAVCSLSLDGVLGGVVGGEPSAGDDHLVAAEVSRRVAELDRVARPRGCVGDAIVEALFDWAAG